MNLYELLGLEKDAAPSLIRKAYKQLSQKHHPDKGGDVDLFKRIKEAYDILISPSRRLKYDQTGSTDYISQEAKDTKMRTDIIGLFFEVVDKQDLFLISRSDIKTEMVNAVSATIRNIEIGNNSNRTKMNKYSVMVKKIKFSGEHNYIKDVLIEKIKSLETLCQTNKENILYLNECIKEIEKFNFETELEVSIQNHRQYYLGNI